MASITKFLGRVSRIYYGGVMATICGGIVEISSMLVDRDFRMSRLLKGSCTLGITGLYCGYMTDISIDKIAPRFWKLTYDIVHKNLTVAIWTNVYLKSIQIYYSYIGMCVRSYFSPTPVPPMATGPVSYIHAPIIPAVPTVTAIPSDIRDTVIDNEDQLIM